LKLSASLEAAFNDQILLEFESVYAYLQLAADFEERHWSGFSRWMNVQSQEEWGHATRFTDFVLQRGSAVRLRALGAPSSGFASPLEAFERALAHEKRVSAAIHTLYAKVMAENDYSSLPLLQWFVNEQVEEEDNVGRIVERIRLVGSDNTGMLFLDRELGARVPSADSPATGATPGRA
jgi:ferritin